jgi:small subunit ribosomal protein S3
MSHKVHPKIFRIKRTKDWDSRGFYGKKISQYLEEDFIIREFLKKKLKDASIENIKIERSANQLRIIIRTSRPGLIIGRGGEGINKLKEMLQHHLTRKKKTPQMASREIKLEIAEVRNPWVSASLSSQWIAQQIEKRVPYRRVLKRALDKITTAKEVKGARVEVSGRLDGIEISRTEWLKKGQLPRQTIRADIDYAKAKAYCTYGVVGVKVWIYKGERFEEEK